MIDGKTAGILVGIAIVIVLAGAFAFLIPPVQSDDNLIVINRGSSNGTATSCDNLGSGAEVYKNTTDNTCYFRTLVGSSDISVTQQFSTIMIDFNGTSGESTECFNVGSGTVIIKNSTSGNCYVKTFVNGNGITISNGSNTVTFTNSGVLKDVAGNGITVNQTTGNVLITNTLPEASSASNVGNGANVFKNETSDTFYFKTILVGNGLTISNGTNTITLTNSLPENTSGANVGSGKVIFKNETSDVLYYKSLVGSADISITNTSNTVVIDYNGTAVTSVTSNSNTTIGVITSGGAVTLYPKYVLLCQNSLGSSANSLSCSGFTGKRHLYIEYEVYGVTSTVLLGMQFNSDTGTNYSFRMFSNGGADSGAVSRNNITLNGNSIPAGGTLTGYYHCNNDASHRKLCNGESTQDANAGSATTVNYSATSAKWANTANQITTVTLVRGGLGLTGSFNTGTNISVWGYD